MFDQSFKLCLKNIDKSEILEFANKHSPTPLEKSIFDELGKKENLHSYGVFFIIPRSTKTIV